jgi:ABC-type multidrug transport system fused ATPase/permease subunit
MLSSVSNQSLWQHCQRRVFAAKTCTRALRQILLRFFCTDIIDGKFSLPGLSRSLSFQMLRFARPLPSITGLISIFPASRFELAHQLRSFSSSAKALKSAKAGSKAGNAKIVAVKQAKAQQQQNVDPYMEASTTAPSDVPDTQTQKIVCSLTDLSKKLPNGNFLFRNISLSFFQGAKIGVIGINGAGKVLPFEVLYILVGFVISVVISCSPTSPH